MRLPDGTDVAGLLVRLGIDRSLASIVVVNGRICEVSTTLSHGDKVDLVPPVTGGRLLPMEAR